MSDGVIQQEGIWRSEEYKTYTVYNIADDAKRVSRKSDKDKGVERQPGEGTVWGVARREIPCKLRRMTACLAEGMVEYNLGTSSSALRA